VNKHHAGNDFAHSLDAVCLVRHISGKDFILAEHQLAHSVTQKMCSAVTFAIQTVSKNIPSRLFAYDVPT
jgi:hypothetical protein